MMASPINKITPGRASAVITGALSVIIFSGCATVSSHTQPQSALRSDSTAAGPIIASGTSARTARETASQSYPAMPLTLSDAINRALECSPEVAELRNKMESAAYALPQKLRDPELRLSYGEDSTTVNRHRWTGSGGSDTTGKTDNDSSAYRVALRFYLPEIWSQSSIELQRKASYNAAKAELDAAKQKITAEVLLEYAKIGYIEKSRHIADTLAKLYANKQRQMEGLKDSGTLDSIDSITIARLYLSALSKLTKLDLRYNREIKSLADMLCIPSDQLKIATDTQTMRYVDTSDAGIIELQALMLQNRADLIALGWNRIAAEAALKTMQREHLPWIRHIQLSYGSETGTSTGGDSSVEPGESPEYSYRDDSADSDEWAITTAINIPLYGTDGNESQLLSARIRQAGEEESAQTERAIFQLHDAWLNLRLQQEIRKRHKLRTEPLIRKIITALKAARDTLSFEEQIRMYEDLSAAKQLELELDYNYSASLIQLDKTLGMPLFHTISR